jgi:hypothetical protein
MKFLHEDVDLGYYDLEAVTTDKGRHYEDQRKQYKRGVRV